MPLSFSRIRSASLALAVVVALGAQDGDLAEALDLAQQIGLGLPGGGRLHGVAQPAFGVFQPLLQPLDMGLDILAHRRVRGLQQPILFHGQHLNQLTPPRGASFFSGSAQSREEG